MYICIYYAKRLYLQIFKKLSLIVINKPKTALFPIDIVGVKWNKLVFKHYMKIIYHIFGINL